MPLEIERKFAVTDPTIVKGRLGCRIVQGYLLDEPMTLRVRIIEAESFLTLKKRVDDLTRDEYEFPIPIGLARELLERHCGTRLVKKTRYRIPQDGVVFEVDVFEGKLAGLVLAEVELDHPDQAVVLPDWVGVELTADGRFSNRKLSMVEIPPEISPGAAAGR